MRCKTHGGGKQQIACILKGEKKLPKAKFSEALWIGRRVRRFSPGFGWVDGEVTRRSKKVGDGSPIESAFVWLVTYEHGDTEELTEIELQKGALAANETTEALGDDGAVSGGQKPGSKSGPVLSTSTSEIFYEIPGANKGAKSVCWV